MILHREITPYYFNNPTVPYAAYDMPTYNGIGTPPAQRANNKPMLMNSESLNTVQYGLLANTWGWRLVRSKATGQIVHSDAVGQENPDPNLYTTVYFPVYDSTETRGARIGFDTQIPDPGDLTDTFSTQNPLSNIGSIRLLRSTLPVRKFDTFNPNIFIQPPAPTNAVIFTQGIPNINTANLLNTFHSEPYLLLSIGSLQGNYLGANQCIQNSFTALVQKQRITLDGNATAYLAQYQDYFPWSDEAYTFDPPLSYLSNADLTITNQLGKTFSHLDDMCITQFSIGFCDAPITASGTFTTLGAAYFGTIQFSIVHGFNVSQQPTVSSNSQFSINDIRPGDELIMYQPVIQQILQDPVCVSNSNLSTFFSNLGSHELFVTTIVVENPIINPGMPNYTTQVGIGVNAVFKYSNLADVYAISSNLSSLISAGQIVIDMIQQTNGGPSTFGSNNYSIPFLNRMMQCTYAFEVVTMQPDTSGLGKIVAL